MDKPDLFIVGAGSVGLLLALRYAKEFRQIDIVESRRHIGGIARDFYDASGLVFFRGCQYLSREYLPDDTLEKLNLYSFEHRYSSITEQGRQWNFSRDFSGPAFRIDSLDISVKQTKVTSVQEALDQYPSNIRNHLESFISRVTKHDLSKLHSSSLTSLSMDRITSTTDEDKLLKLKQSDGLIDALYGVRREILGLSYEMGYLPKLGYDSFFQSMSEYLKEQAKVNFHISLNFRPEDIAETDLIPNLQYKLWCADPRPVVKYCTGYNLQSLSYSVHIYGLLILQHSNLELPYYINVFSASNPILRLFFYSSDSEVKISVESVSPFGSQLELIEAVQKLLIHTSLEIKFGAEIFAYRKTRRYVPITISDYINIESSMKALGAQYWRDTYPYLYGRKERLSLITSDLDHDLPIPDPN